MSAIDLSYQTACAAKEISSRGIRLSKLNLFTSSVNQDKSAPDRVIITALRKRNVFVIFFAQIYLFNGNSALCREELTIKIALP